MIGTSIGNSLIWDNGTNVGIGNTNTSYTLDVTGSGRYLSGNEALRLDTTSTAFDTSIRFYNNNSATYWGGIQAGPGAISGGGMNIYNNGAYPMAFNVNGSERMRITSAGNVGIGTTAPIGPLDIAFPVADGATISASNAQTAYNYSRLRIKHYSGSNLGLSIGYAGANYTYIQACYNEGTAAPLLLNPFSGNVTINNAITNAQLSVGNSGGNWGVMVQDFVANGALMKFHSSDGTSVGSITFNGSVTVYSTTSDYRLKEDFKDIKGLEKISAIKVYDFKFKNSGKRMDGVIAHELQEVIPYAVYGEKNALNEDGTIHAQGVDYSLLTPVLVKAIQEMNAKLDEQNQTIQNLQEQINILAK
jgi:hypothetical protein